MTQTALLDACALFSVTLTDLLLRVAAQKLFIPKWSDRILTELQRAVLSDSKVTLEGINYRIDRMRRSFPFAEVRGFESLIDKMTCDEKDRHVLAAAVFGECDVLVTFNVRDFPLSSVQELGIGVLHPDDFLIQLVEGDQQAVRTAMQAMVTARIRPQVTVTELTSRLERAGVPNFAAEINRMEWPSSR